MASKKGARQVVMLESTAGTGFRYYTTKNKRNSLEKLKLRKFDPMVKRHVEFIEKKLPSHSK